MSRVGKYPIAIPSGVQVTLDGSVLTVKGKLGTLTLLITEEVDVKVEASEVSVSPKTKERQSRNMWGTTRALIASMIDGVTTGYKKSLEINGTGYRAAVQGAVLVLNLGFSHEVAYPVPPGINVSTPRPTLVVIEGIDKRQVGQVAAEIISYRPPEPYKGKGVKYENVAIRRKEGKKK
jgi:large subunit ribosomal protein L6